MCITAVWPLVWRIHVMMVAWLPPRLYPERLEIEKNDVVVNSQTENELSMIVVSMTSWQLYDLRSANVTYTICYLAVPSARFCMERKFALL